jgi:hypothetical protein
MISSAAMPRKLTVVLGRLCAPFRTTCVIGALTGHVSAHP